MFDEHAAKEAYGFQSLNAAIRGIEFRITFEDWCNWWHQNLGSNWQSKRGRRHGQYVMARKGDSGPYKLGNLECILATENSKQQILNGTSSRGERNGAAKLTEDQVIEIFHAEGSYHPIAKKYNTTRSRVYRIKTGRTWGYITRKLLKEKGDIGT